MALRDMEPNEAVTYSYGERGVEGSSDLLGRHPNEHFLLYYGASPYNAW